MLIDQWMSWAQVLTVCSVMMSWHVVVVVVVVGKRRIDIF